MPIPRLTDKNVIRSRFQDGIRRHVGYGRTLSVADAADYLGDSPSTIKKWLAGESTPQWPSMFRLMELIPELRHDLLPDSAGAELPVCPVEVMAESAHFAAQQARHLADDGVICEREARKSVRPATKLLVLLGQFVRRYQ